MAASAVLKRTEAQLSSQPIRIGYRPEIDGLRALAVLAVIVNHVNHAWLPSGYLGVDIFFVISGYVITASLLSRRHESAADFLLGFYSRRVKRILPALVVFVLVAGGAIAFFSPGGPSLRTGLAALFGLSNIYLFQESTNYFAQATDLNMFTHTWSLGVEEQFYFIYPLLVWFSGVPRRLASSRRRLFWLVLIGSIVSLALWLFLNRINQVAAYFLMPARFWELGAGCLICLGLPRLQVLPLAQVRGVGLTVVAAMAAVLFLPESATVLATMAMIVLTGIFLVVVRKAGFAYGLFSQPQVVFIGLISYSLYLWHWGVLCLSRWTIGLQAWLLPLLFVFMLFLAILSYQCLEKPLREAVWSPKRTVTIGMGVVGTGVSAGLLVIVSNSLRRISPVKPNPELSYQTHLIGWKPCAPIPIGSEDRKEGNCQLLGGPSLPVRVVVLGDSHAGHLSSGLRSIFPSLSASMVSVYQEACYPRIDSDCSIIRNGFEWALATSSVKVVILSGYHNLVLHNNRYHWQGIDHVRMVPGALESLERSMNRTLGTLTAAGKSVVMVVDSHELTALPEENIIPLTGLVRAQGGLDVRRDEVIKRNHAYYRMLERLAKRYPDFHIFYSGHYLCAPKLCQSDLHGQPLFQTRDHLTPYGSRVLAKNLKPLLERLLAAPRSVSGEGSRNVPR